MPSDATGSSKRAIREKLKRQLSEHYSCYVLITCEESDESGKMQVEMSYDGDPVVAAYLLEGAQDFIDADENDGDQFPLRHC